VCTMIRSTGSKSSPGARLSAGRAAMSRSLLSPRSEIGDAGGNAEDRQNPSHGRRRAAMLLSRRPQRALHLRVRGEGKQQMKLVTVVQSKSRPILAVIARSEVACHELDEWALPGRRDAMMRPTRNNIDVKTHRRIGLALEGLALRLGRG
jgi:hypothetical protein